MRGGGGAGRGRGKGEGHGEGEGRGGGVGRGGRGRGGEEGREREREEYALGYLLMGPHSTRTHCHSLLAHIVSTCIRTYVPETTPSIHGTLVSTEKIIWHQTTSLVNCTCVYV